MNNFYDELKNHSLDDLNYCLSNACNIGRLDIVRYLLTSNELTINADINSDEDVAFRIACQKGHLEIVKYLLTSPELKTHSNISAKDNEGLQWAAAHGYLEVVKFIMTSSNLKEHAKIGDNDCNALTMACAGGHIDIVDYFINKAKVDIHIFNDSAFISGCYNKQYNLLSFLIFECNIPKTNFISEHLQKNHDSQIDAMFISRDNARGLSMELESSLILNKNKEIKIKI